MTHPFAFDRRSFVIGSSLVMAGCTTCRFPSPNGGSYEIADAHAHFFNLADLPVRDFMRDVVIPQQFPDLPDIVLALVNIAAGVTQAFAPSAREEIGHLERSLFEDDARTSTDTFGNEIKDLQEQAFAREGMVEKSLGDPETSLAASHLSLARRLGALKQSATGDRNKRGGATTNLEIDASVYSRIASGRDAQAAISPDKLNSQGALANINLRATLRWIYQMIQPRCEHVETYIKTIFSAEAKVGHAINLLVDYDRWLQDDPKKDLDHADQIEFWTRYEKVARRKGSPIQLHTFAGYDPLKHAGQRLAGETPSFETMLGWVDADEAGASHRIAGFKLYPPMGFNPSSNRDFSLPCDCRGAHQVKTWWEKAGWDVDRIGEELDISLDCFFRACAKRDIPMLAHAANSLASMPGAGAKASPKYWLERARTVRDWGGNPLRVCLGHFHTSPENADYLAQIIALNRPTSSGRPGARIYVDMSYDQDILDGHPTTILDFYAGVCEAAGDDGRHILFGSDWIMLGREPEAGNYLSQFRAAAADHCFWHDKVDRLFRRNLLEFLKLAPPETT
tara:strand:- start:549 stop:2243 length:1695 start_codon:yes stop_codon:yes gene_type:complete